MKYGLLVYKETENIGDDIQSYASKRYLPKIDYYVEREKLDEFLPNEKDDVAVIMNGWFMHNKQSFPPTDYIIPHLVSMHFSIGNNWTLDKSLYLDKYSKEYLNKNGPVGSRDYVTMERLKEMGINTYYSGCLTLTIEKFQGVKKKEYICSVDLGEEKNDKLREYFKDLNQEIIYTTHEVNPVKNSRLSFEQRFKNVEDLLKLYQGSKGVITTRLHCALPCLALGVPVILIYNENSYDRLGTFEKLMKLCSEKDFLKKDSNIEFYINNEEVNKIKDNLTKSCETFIKNVSIENRNIKLLEIEDYKKVNKMDYIKWKKNIMNIEINDLKKDIEWFKSKISDKEIENNITNSILQKEIEKNKALQKRIDDIEKKNAYKIYKKIKNLIKND
jgi:hypothetical protein